MHISTDLLKDRPPEFNSRPLASKEYDDRLDASIKEYGILLPITVREDLTVIAGQRRLEAARRVGLIIVPIEYGKLRTVNKFRSNLH